MNEWERKCKMGHVNMHKAHGQSELRIFKHDHPHTTWPFLPERTNQTARMQDSTHMNTQRQQHNLNRPNAWNNMHEHMT